MKNVDLSKSLEQLEANPWPQNDFQSHVVQESQRLRKVSLQDLTVEDLRLLIGQKIGLEFTVPLAIEQLQRDPFAEGNHYRGDLLANVLALPNEFWESHPALNNVMVELAVELKQIHELLAQELLPAIGKFRYR